MSLTSFLVLLALSLICLACSIYSLVGSTEWRRSFNICWVVFAAMLVYGVVCYGSLDYWRRRTREKSLTARHTGQNVKPISLSSISLNDSVEAHDRTDDIFHIHKQIRAIHRERTPNASTTTSTATLPAAPRKDSAGSNHWHPGPLTSNPPHEPPRNFHSLPPLPRNLSEMVIHPADFHTASTISISTAQTRSIQIAARPRAVTDTGKPTAAATAASRVRANSLKHVKEATASLTHIECSDTDHPTAVVASGAV